MHIVLVCREYVGSFRAGGIASYLQEMAIAYSKLNHRVTIITASENTSEESVEEIANSITVIKLSGGDFINPRVEKQTLLRCFRFLYRFYSYRKRIRKKIIELKDIDIIEVADYGAEGLYLQNIGIPVVLRTHTPLSLDIPTLTRCKPKVSDVIRYLGLKAENKIFKEAQYISSCSKALLDWLEANMGINPKLTSVVKNPSSIRVLPDKSSKQSHSIFYGGTICESKGVGDLIEACIILRNKGIPVKLELAGKGGRYYNQLLKRVKDHNWNWITFLGKLPREEMFSKYASSYICCFPSWWENMPMVCIEAMSVGAVVIASSSGGAKEIINDSEDGFIVERKNPQQLAACIEKVFSLKSDDFAKIGEKAEAHIRSNFTPAVIANEMLDFYSDVIDDFTLTNHS